MNPSKSLTIASCPIITNNELMPGTHLIWLEASQIAATARPGQFVMVRCGEDTLLRRPLSVHQVEGVKIALLFAIVGRGTHWLSRRQAGDTLDIFGPLGNGFSINPTAKNLLLVAGGIGIAPLCFLAQEAVSQGHSVTLLLGAKTASRLYPEKLIPSGIKLFTATEDGTKGKKDMVIDLLPDFVDRADQVFACGPLAMYCDMALRKKKLKIEGKPIQLSLEIMMGCGVGVCYGCTIKTRGGLKQVCKDGPVFELEDVIWEEFSGV